MSTTTELQTWLNGTPTGGPNGDGRYPLTAKDGQVFLVYCPAAQALNPTLADQPVELFAEAANASAVAANEDALAADAARIAAQSSASNAAASATTAGTHKDAAAASASAAATSATNAATSKTGADTAKNMAETARNLAQDWASKAENSIVSGGLYSSFHWAQKAAASAASVSLGNYYTKTEANSLLAGKVDDGGAFADAFAATPLYYNGSTQSIDCNALAEGTRALVQGSGTNSNYPGTGFWHIETVRAYGVNTLIQRAYAYNQAGRVAVRNYNGTTWTAWALEWNSANFDPINKINKAGDTGIGDLSGTAFNVRRGTPGTQQIMQVWSYSNSIDRCYGVLEADGAYSIYLKDAAGVAAPNAYQKLGITLDAKAVVFSVNGISWDNNLVWHAGNFTPANKVDVTQVSSIVDPNTLGGKLAQGVVTATAGNAPSAYTTIWNFGSNGNRDGQLAWYYGSGAPAVWFRSRQDTTGTWNSWAKLWHDLNDGASSGLDADLLDGQQGSYYQNATNLNTGTLADARLPARLGTVAATITDWNTTISNGTYMAYQAANAPAGTGWLMGRVTQHNAAWIQQEVWDFTNVAQVVRYRRHMRSGTWDGWTAVMRLIGDGSPSLDAYNVALTVEGAFGGGIGFVDTGKQARIWMQNEPTLRFGFQNALTGALVEVFRLSDTNYSEAVVQGALRLQGAEAGVYVHDRTTSREWVWYGTGDKFYLFNGSGNILSSDASGNFQAVSLSTTNNNGAYISGNGSGLQVNGALYENGTAYNLAANGAAWIRNPRTFVQSGDPGAQAADGDLWIW